MLVPKLDQSDRPELFLLPPALDDDAPPGSSTGHLRLRLRRWEIRRTWSARALVALTFPMAYLLIMIATGTPPPGAVVRFMVGLWVAVITVGAVCAEAVWRNRTRLERRSP